MGSTGQRISYSSNLIVLAGQLVCQASKVYCQKPGSSPAALLTFQRQGAPALLLAELSGLVSCCALTACAGCPSAWGSPEIRIETAFHSLT